MPDRRAEPRVVLESDPPYPPLDLVRIAFFKVLHNIELDVSPSLRGEPVDRNNFV